MIHSIEKLKQILGFSRWWEHQEHYFSLLPKVIEQGIPIRFFISVPCGWGKTEVALIPFLAQFIERGELVPFSYRMLYILPSQALVTDIMRRIEKYTEKISEKLGIKSLKVERDDGIEREIRFMDIYSGNIVVTTMDSYLARLLSSPLVSKKHKHYFVGKSLRALCVFDEIHSYELYSLGFIRRLINFCNKVNVNHIVMSASLNKLQQKMLGLTEGNEYISKTVYRPKRNCARIIYRDDLHYNGKTSDYVKCVVRLLGEVLCNDTVELRILIMCNTVNKAQATYKELKRTFPKVNLSLLHSRFKIQEKENYVKTATERILSRRTKESNKSGGILVSTQVIESGVDVSADLLISETAPPDALVQRFGRCARELRCPEEPKINANLGEIHVVPVDIENVKTVDERPYPYPWILASQVVLEKFCKGNENVMDAELIEELVKATPAPLLNSKYRDYFHVCTETEQSLTSFVKEGLGIHLEKDTLKRLYGQFLEGQREANTWISHRIWGYIEKEEWPRFRQEERINLIIEKPSVERLLKMKQEIDTLRSADDDLSRDKNYFKEKKLWKKMRELVQRDSIRVNKKTLCVSVKCIYGNTYYDPSYSYSYDKEIGMVSKEEEEDV